MTRELYMGYERNFSSTGMYSGQEAYYKDRNRIFDYLDEHISKKRFFHNEYINLCFIKKISAKIKYIKFKYVVDKENIQASNFKSTWTINKDEKTNKSENVSFPKTKTKIPLVFKFETWLLKQMFKIRNFKEIYIKKTISKWGTL